MEIFPLRYEFGTLILANGEYSVGKALRSVKMEKIGANLFRK